LGLQSALTRCARTFIEANVEHYKSTNNMEANQKQVYEAPATEVVEVVHAGAICALSGNNVTLYGAGVDENDADDNGSSIW
jgi:hypothetical protein